MKSEIGIIGMGFVGEILRRYYPFTKWYDIKDPPEKLDDVLRCKYIFIAFNLKDNAITGTEPIEAYLEKMLPDTIVIIKSTFVPGTTDKLQAKYPHLNIVYNCEFLTEATAWEDFSAPQFQILGMPHKTLELANDLFKLLPKARVNRIISPLDAEILKHAKNSYYGLKVTWFNQLYDACAQMGADYESVREVLVQDPWIGDSHSIYMHKGYAGWGGKCLSKDIPALSRVANFPILKHIIEYNETLRKKQGL